MFRKLSTALMLSLSLLFTAGLAQDEVRGRNDTLNEMLQSATESVFRSVAVVHSGDDKVGYAICVGEGVFVTASRVVEEGGSYTLTAHDGRTQSADLGATDHQEGLTLLLCEALQVPVQAISATSALKVGQFVVAVGATVEPIAGGVLGQQHRAVEAAEAAGPSNPFMQMFADENNAGPARTRPDVLHHDAPLSDDEFGSALVDASGQLLGLNVDRPYRGSSHAVPVQRLQLETLLKGEDIQAKRRPFLGVEIEEKAGEGILVQGVIEGGAAEAAGIGASDLIVALDGKPTQSIDQLRAALAGLNEGDQVNVTVRNAAGETVEKQLTLGGR